MKIWDIHHSLNHLYEQLNNIEICKIIIANVVKVSEKSVLWTDNGIGFFIDNDYGYYKLKPVVIFRILFEYLIIYIGFDGEHQCFSMSDPNFIKNARDYLKKKAGKWIRRF